MEGLARDVVAVIVSQIGVIDSIYLQRCCTSLYNKVIVVTNRKERRWMKCLQAGNSDVVICESIACDNFRWVSVIKIDHWTYFQMAAHADAVQCAEYIYNSSGWDLTYVGMYAITMLWYEVYDKNWDSKWCRQFCMRLHGQPYDKVVCTIPVNGEVDSSEEFRILLR
jgi:hypothetical protein